MKAIIRIPRPVISYLLLFAILFLLASCSVHFKGTEVEAGGEIVSTYQLESTSILCAQNDTHGLVQLDL